MMSRNPGSTMPSAPAGDSKLMPPPQQIPLRRFSSSGSPTPHHYPKQSFPPKQRRFFPNISSRPAAREFVPVAFVSNSIQKGTFGSSAKSAEDAPRAETVAYEFVYKYTKPNYVVTDDPNLWNDSKTVVENVPMQNGGGSGTSDITSGETDDYERRSPSSDRDSVESEPKKDRSVSRSGSEDSEPASEPDERDESSADRSGGKSETDPDEDEDTLLVKNLLDENGFSSDGEADPSSVARIILGLDNPDAAPNSAEDKPSPKREKGEDEAVSKKSKRKHKSSHRKHKKRRKEKEDKPGNEMDVQQPKLELEEGEVLDSPEKSGKEKRKHKKSRHHSSSKRKSSAKDGEERSKKKSKKSKKNGSSKESEKRSNSRSDRERPSSVSADRIPISVKLEDITEPLSSDSDSDNGKVEIRSIKSERSGKERETFFERAISNCRRSPPPSYVGCSSDRRRSPSRSNGDVELEDQRRRTERSPPRRSSVHYSSSRRSHHASPPPSRDSPDRRSSASSRNRSPVRHAPRPSRDSPDRRSSSSRRDRSSRNHSPFRYSSPHSRDSPDRRSAFRSRDTPDRHSTSSRKDRDSRNRSPFRDSHRTSRRSPERPTKTSVKESPSRSIRERAGSFNGSTRSRMSEKEKRRNEEDQNDLDSDQGRTRSASSSPKKKQPAVHDILDLIEEHLALEDGQVISDSEFSDTESSVSITAMSVFQKKIAAESKEKSKRSKDKDKHSKSNRSHHARSTHSHDVRRPRRRSLSPEPYRSRHRSLERVLRRGRSVTPPYRRDRHLAIGRQHRASSFDTIATLDTINRDRLRQVAIENAVELRRSGKMPPIYAMTAEEKKVWRAGGRELDALTAFCKKMAQRAREADSVSEAGDLPIHSHPFYIKERPLIHEIRMTINNAKPLPVKSAEERRLANLPLRELFPVSTGSMHRGLTWERVVTKDKPEPMPAYCMPAPKKTRKASPEPEEQLSLAEQLAKALPPPDYRIPISFSDKLRLLKFQRELAVDPDNPDILNKMQETHEQMMEWANQFIYQGTPGEFSGEQAPIPVGRDLHQGEKQAWVRRDQMMNLAPVEGKGRYLLQKMGWQLGQRIGIRNTGVLEPIRMEIKLNKRGLVACGERGFKAPLSTVVSGGQGGAQQKFTFAGSFNQHPCSALNEFCTKKGWGTPNFKEAHETVGPGRFMFVVEVNGVTYRPTVSGNSKKIAKAEAAQFCLQALGAFK